MSNKHTIFAREGNKSRYLDELYPLFPTGFRYYVEPFLGTGAVFLGLQNIPLHSFVNDHDKFIFYFFLVMSTRRGAEKLAHAIEQKLIYYPLMEAMHNSDGLIDFLANKIIYQATSVYGYGNTLSLTPNNGKALAVQRLYDLKNHYLTRMAHTKITNMHYGKFLRSIGAKGGSYDNFFVYADPPYVLQDAGNLKSNKSFTKEDLTTLVDILKSRNWKFAISCMDSGASFFQERGLIVTPVKKSSGIAATMGHQKTEWIATNYPPPPRPIRAYFFRAQPIRYRGPASYFSKNLIKASSLLKPSPCHNCVSCP